LYKIPANTLFTGKNLVFMPECHSTNSIAMELCQKSPVAPEGTVVITAHQTQGRGQRGNSWVAAPGKNFTFSLILHPIFLDLGRQFYLNVFTSLAIRDYLQLKGCPKAMIKWPNDVFVGGMKICGILMENQLTGQKLSRSIIGIGLNMNQEHFEMASVTSMRLATGREFDLQAEFETLLGMIEVRYLQLRSGELERLMEDYLAAMYWINEMHTFRSEERYFDGIICGLDESGRLRVRVGSDEKVFGTKEISYEH